MLEMLGLSGQWGWFILGMTLIIAEIFVSGTLLLWMGMSALLVGGITLLFPGISWTLQLLIFTFGAFASIFAWWRYGKKLDDSAAPQLNQRGAAYVGRVYPLVRPIVGGRGKVNIDDTLWTVEGPDLPEGSLVKVVALDGNALRVERVD